MALFKICRGNESNLPTTKTDGYAYFCTDTGNFFIDYKNSSNTVVRVQINSDYANGLRYLDGDEYVKISTEGIIAQITSAAADSLTSANTYTDENIASLSEGFSNVIYQMYGNDATEDGAPTIRAIANDEANTALESAKDYTDDAVAGKANASHTHDDRYYTETEIDTKLALKSDSTHNHDSSYDAKGSASAVQENLNTVSDTLDAHTENTGIHVTAANKSNWNTAYTHSQSSHARVDATKVEDSTTNGNILINDSEINVYSHPNSGVTAGTYKSVTVNAQGHVTAGSNPNTLSAYGITDAETKTDANAKLTEAKTYTDSVASGKSDTTHKHDNLYDAKGAAADSLVSANEYTDTKTSGLASTTVVDNKISNHNASTSAHNDIRELITNLSNRLNTLADSDDTTLDQMSEIVEYIKTNKSLIDAVTTSKINVSDIVNNLTTNSTSSVLSAAQGVAIKALIDALQEELDDHTHEIADVSGLQTALDGKAASSHGTHVSYSTTAPVMDGTASVGTASTVARSDHKHPTDTSRASKTEFDTHVSDTTKHITATERTNWNAAKTHADSAHAPSNAEKNQNAFSNVKVGTTTIAADTTTDTLELVGSNVTITPDATNDKVTFAVADGTTSAKGVVQLTNSTSSTSTTTAATPSSVKSAYDLANTAKTNAATAQSKADSAYTLAEGKVDSLADLGITATAAELNKMDGVTATTAELNYVDGVTSNIQTQLNQLSANKADSDHTHTASEIGAATPAEVLAVEQDLATTKLNLASHTHNYAGSSSAGGAANSVKTKLTVKLNGGSTEGTNLFTYNGSTAKTVNITPSAIGAAASSHSHSYLPLSGGTLTGSLGITMNDISFSVANQNASFTHYSTGGSSGHWFNKPVYVTGDIYAGSGYNKLVLHTGNTSDYVTAQGTSGIWTYRKWNSGVAECWTNNTAAGINIDKSWGNVYYNYALASKAYPFTFTAKPVVLATPISTSGDFWLCASSSYPGSTTACPAFHAIAASSINSVQANIQVYAVGRWK